MQVFMGANFGLFPPTLQSLVLVEVDLDDRFIDKFFCKHLSVIGQSLRELDLSHNHIGNSHTFLMRALQQKCELLTTLSLV